MTPGRTIHACPALIAALILASLTSPSPQAADLFTDDSGPLEWLVPDDTEAGVASTLWVAEGGLVRSVSITLELSVPVGSTGWVGDLYAYVQHGSGSAVLLNRVGRAPDRLFGYDDEPLLNLTFQDAGAQGDIHDYRLTLAGTQEATVSGTVSGVWEPSGRMSDPQSVLEAHPRPSMLAQFDGMPAAGGWTLFVADLSGGGAYRLDRRWAWWLRWRRSCTGMSRRRTAPGRCGVSAPRAWCGSGTPSMPRGWRRFPARSR